MLEILEAPTSEAPRRYISKEERRARFHYFTFRPTAHGPLEKTCTGGGATPSPPRSPPPQYAHGRVEGGVAVVGADVDDKGLTPTGPATLKPRLRNGPAASASEGSPPAYNAAIAAVVEEGVSTEAGAVITVVGDVSERSAALHSCDGEWCRGSPSHWFCTNLIVNSNCSLGRRFTFILRDGAGALRCIQQPLFAYFTQPHVSRSLAGGILVRRGCTFLTWHGGPGSTSPCVIDTTRMTISDASFAWKLTRFVSRPLLPVSLPSCVRMSAV